ncbi:hypothetical protein LWI29_013631 [Acer saccharum]|uniref:DOMON domain-containing protein n=1 Tax=Acer saccharum TaxID=4024 RepID=A0AA39SWI7_ACESA|nr:hypothetical protein LWI29_013631 [Acer saccharum]
MYRGNDLEDEEMNDDELSEEDDTKIDEEFYEAIKILVMTVQAVIHVVNEFRVFEAGRQIERPLNPRRINNVFGYNYIHRALNDDPAIFRRGPVTVFILALFSLLSTTSQHSTCSEAFTKLKEEREMSHCMKLPVLGSEFAWNYHDLDHTTRIDIFFGTRLHAEIGWLAWGVNPTNELKNDQYSGHHRKIRLSNGALAIDTYNVTGSTKVGCGLQPSKIVLIF